MAYPDLHKIAFESPKLKDIIYLPNISIPQTVHPPFYHFLNLAYFCRAESYSLKASIKAFLSAA